MKTLRIIHDMTSKNDLDEPTPCKKCYKPTYTLYPGRLCGECYETKIRG